MSGSNFRWRRRRGVGGVTLNPNPQSVRTAYLGRPRTDRCRRPARLRDGDKTAAGPIDETQVIVVRSVFQVSIWVIESLVLPSAVRNCTGTPPSVSVVRKNSSCFKSGR